MTNLDEHRQLVDDVVYASTKKEAQHPLNRLKFLAARLQANMDPYSARKLDQVISYAEEASGRVRDKQHWINQVDQCWYVFKNCEAPLEAGDEEDAALVVHLLQHQAAGLGDPEPMTKHQQE